MQRNVIGYGPLSDIAVGRESEEMCLLARLFNGFANSTRLSILLLLVQRGEMKVGELVEELEAPQPRVSDHLRCLSGCGYVQVRREGRNAYYSVSDERILTILGLGEELLRDNRECLEACDTIKKDL
ncbi:MAG: Transcriptional regulator, ArsR family [uncultured Rubrobacteraceae bacterium]|uniref:Transcriptional regulator, ArsR family n=1 Tax=uncultured Rubrobacteraceae bacterium TaxID=349277 RepID=A0A6J4RMW8_9ACTN|nr:MAG: Transcriptional regulator, ArsR family [uncultured Rubrobacteraceae bacterium]